MSHMVIFQTPDGNPGYNQFETVNEAVSFVEKLRNEQNVETARIFALEEVKFDFKPYFRVELNSLGPSGSSTVTTPPTEAPSPFASPEPPQFSEPYEPAAPAFEQPTYGDGPAYADEPAFGEQSPVGNEPVSVGAPPPPPSFLSGPQQDPGDTPQTTRRGLFGR